MPAFFFGCGPRESPSSPRATSVASSPPAALIATPLGPLSYDVTFDARTRSLEVDATLPRGTPHELSVDNGAEPFVRDVRVAAGSAWQAVEPKGTSWSIPACTSDGCHLHYRMEIGAACERIDDPDVASEEGEALEAPPSAWLLAPVEGPAATRVRFRVKSATPDARFVTGVFVANDDPSAYEISLDDLRTSPYSAFGAFRVSSVDVAGSHVTVAIAPGALAVDDAAIVSWVESCARAVAGFYARFPMPSALVLVFPGRGDDVGFGKSLSGGGASTLLHVGDRADKAALANDWVLVHEMTHFAFPAQPRTKDWVEEGLATYVEPLARAKAGTLDERTVWRGYHDGFHFGLPRRGDHGLDHTHTWGRIYWGGALFFFEADLEIRKATKGAKGLIDALRAILAGGGTNAVRWDLTNAFAVGDRAVGVPVLSTLYSRWGAAPVDVDLQATWKELGVVVDGGTIRFDDTAPLASIRTGFTR